MEGALIILTVTVVAGVIIYLLDVVHRKRAVESRGENESSADEPSAASGSDENRSEESRQEEAQGATADDHGPVCCGRHLVCEKDTLSPFDSKIIYFDDEELDRFIGRDGLDYTPEEIEEFQEILITLNPEDVVGWARSITQRRIELPPVVRDELLMMVNEQRGS